MGTQGNDKADSLAKAALNMIPEKKNSLYWAQTGNQAKKWQQLWEKKFFQVEPILKERKLDPNDTRREETTLARLRIGHTRLTHAFILKDEPPPKWPCGNQYTIKRILTECTELTNIRQRFYNVDNMKELFGKIDPKQILNFLKIISLLLKMKADVFSILAITWLCANKLLTLDWSTSVRQ